MAKNQVNLFLSHKGQDETIARGVKEELEKYTAGRLTVQMFEDISAGRPWEACIHEALQAADILLLLYTDPSAEWDWCLYEAGWFTPLEDKERGPIICLHSPAEQPPKPLRKFVTVKADAAHIKKHLLVPLFRTTELVDVDPVLGPTLSDEDLQQIAERVAASVLPRKLTSRYYRDRIRVEVRASEILEAGGVPEDAKVVSREDRLEVLDWDQKRFTWKELVDRAASTEGYGTYWIPELEKAIVKAARKATPPVLTATFRGVDSGNIYRPILYRVDRDLDEPCRFFVAFNEELEPEIIGGPGRLGLAFNLLRLANRFRWEVTEPFRKRFARDGVDAIVLCRQLMESMAAIEDEAKRHGYLDRENVRPLYPGEAEKELDRSFDRWQEIRRELAQAVDGAPEPAAIRPLLEELDQMNLEFLAHVSGVYAKLLVAPLAVAPQEPALV